MTLPSLVSGTVCCSVVYEHSSFPYHGKVGATSIDSQYLHCQKCLGSQKELRTPGPVSCNQTLFSPGHQTYGEHLPWRLWCIQHEGTSFSIIQATVSLTITLLHTETCGPEWQVVFVW